MTEWDKAETLIANYIQLWQKVRGGGGSTQGIFEDNDFGFENLQLIRNGYNYLDFTQDDLLKTAVLLTRELQAQINSDHKYYWAFTCFLANSIHEVSLLRDYQWCSIYSALINTVLSQSRQIVFPEPKSDEEFFDNCNRRKQADVLKNSFVNFHMLALEDNRWEIAAPLAFAVLEGLLRRKNKNFMNEDGKIVNDFAISTAKGTQLYGSKGKKRINSIADEFRCLEQYVLPAANRNSTHIIDIKKEIECLVPSSANKCVYDEIYDWRNNFLHGHDYWIGKVPIILNLISLLVIDEIEPSLLASQSERLHRKIRSEINNRSWTLSMNSIYPPDL